MIVDPDFLDHWRTGMVIDALGDPMAPIYIMRLWAHCQTRKSDTFTMPARGLKSQCKFPGDADLFESALIEAGFLARDGDDLKALGWAEQNASLLAAWDNGARGGRPRKNPDKTHGKPMANPTLTHGEPMANPDKTDKSREDKNSSSLRSEEARDARATQPQKPDDVDAQVWRDWCELRKGHKAKVSETAVRGARAEAQKAGMTLEAFLRVWCVRGSRGLEASWLRPNELASARASPQSFHEREQALKAARVAEFAPHAAARRQPAPEVIDITPRQAALE